MMGKNAGPMRGSIIHGSSLVPVDDWLDTVFAKLGKSRQMFFFSLSLILLFTAILMPLYILFYFLTTSLFYKKNTIDIFY